MMSNMLLATTRMARGLVAASLALMTLAAGSTGGQVRDDALYGVSCTSLTQCMAVGRRAVGTAGNFRPLAESWDGGKWRVVPMPGPARLVRTQLSAVSCKSGNECIAVGYHYGAAGGPTSDLAEEWNGAGWRIIQSSNPVSNASSGFLSGVSCKNSPGCIAVGGYAGQSGDGHALAQVWTGLRWTLQPVPVPAGARESELNDISCGARHCMAVGTYKDASGRILTLADRWNGSEWSLLLPANADQPVSALSSVSCNLTTLCLAVGFSYGTQDVPIAELWADGRWRMVPGGRVADAALTGISCPGRAWCIAVGSAASEPLTEAWSGSDWRVLPAARASGHQDGELSQLSCRTATARCFAVGDWYRPGAAAGQTSLAQAWNGSSWSVMTTSNP